MNDNILLVGGTGYIGSHMFCALVEAGLKSVILDDLSGSDPSVIAALASITGSPVVFEQGNALDSSWVGDIIERHGVNVVVHLAARKSVAESFADPVGYLSGNIGVLNSVVHAMEKANCRKLIYSSTAAVYDESAPMPVSEESPVFPKSPYAQSKRIGELILEAVGTSAPSWKIIMLRYFNPVGAHPSGRIGENPRGEPTNIMPRLCGCASGRLGPLGIYGLDFPTHDGTGVRDFIHVVDLAEGHVAALREMDRLGPVEVINLGTGCGHSVLELVTAFEKVSGQKVPIAPKSRRPGDAAACWAEVSKARTALGWSAKRSLDAMCKDAWRWHQLQDSRDRV
jgi:UDP-glucose 4-epimerase